MLNKFEFKEQSGSVGIIMTQSQAMLRIMERAEKVADANVPILLMGEIGTEKAGLARYIHSISRRTNAPFISFELFNRHRGAADLSDSVKAANGGTVFFDEIQGMDNDLQNILLKILLEGVVRVEENGESRPLNVQITAATSHDLKVLAQQSKFSWELYYKLALITLELPPLRERPEDIRCLAEYFLDEYSKKHRKIIPGFEDTCLDFIISNKWIGNVKEMENIIEKAVVFSSERCLSIKDLGLDDFKIEALDDCNLKKQFHVAELRCITKALKLSNGDIAKATKLVGLRDNRNQFYKLMRKHQIDASQYRRTSTYYYLPKNMNK